MKLKKFVDRSLLLFAPFHAVSGLFRVKAVDACRGQGINVLRALKKQILR